jgi:hypothetical protein
MKAHEGRKIYNLNDHFHIDVLTKLGIKLLRRGKGGVVFKTIQRIHFKGNLCYLPFKKTI